MVEFDDALKTIISHAIELKSEKVALKYAHKRVLANDTYYDIALPPFDKSAMDGFACRKQDLGNQLDIIEVISAGKKPEKTIGENQCAKIMTGAVVPKGANCVMMKEYVKEISETQVSFTKDDTHPNICYIGEDVKVGDLALPKNTLITPRHIPILAGAGISEPEVVCQPRITVFATGSELVEPNETPESFQIRNSNSSQTLAQLEEMSIKGKYGGIISDNFDETKQKISFVFEKSDIVVLSGGVSEGDFDFIPTVIKDLGFEIFVTRIAVQPGKPIIFAKKDNQYCFGLAGNPTSSFIQFELYLKPFLYKLMRHQFEPEILKAKLLNDYSRKKTERLKFIPVHFNNDMTITQVEYHGSAHINSLIHANSLMMIPIGISEFKKGDYVNVRRL